MREKDMSFKLVYKDIILTACETDINYAEVARYLGLPRSTTMHHLKRIEEITGLSPQRLNDLVKLRDMVKGEENGWIPCAERLPEIEGTMSEWATDIGRPFLITDSGGSVYTSTFWAVENAFEDDAVAWQPMPKPYEGGNDE